MREPVENFILIEGFDKYLGIDATGFIQQLDARVPRANAGTDIEPGELAEATVPDFSHATDSFLAVHFCARVQECCSGSMETTST